MNWSPRTSGSSPGKNRALNGGMTPPSSPFVVGASGGLLDWGGTQYNALEITQPRSGLPANHRATRAYTGLSYNIKVACVGGVYPYRYELVSGAPSGMTINASTGVITWPSPDATTGTITVRVTDTKAATATATWSITVGTSGWIFVDAVNGTTFAGGGTGTFANPYRTMEDVFEHTAATDACYFRAGNYTYAGIVRGDYPGTTDGQYVDAVGSCIWLAYPGDAQPVLSAGYDEIDETTSTNCYLYTNIIYIQGFEIHSAIFKFFEFAATTTGPTIRDNWFHNFFGTTSNASMIMAPHTAGVYGTFVNGNEFDGSDSGQIGLAILIYDSDRYLMSDNEFHDLGAAFSPKDSARFWTFRNNHVHTMPLGHTLSSNMNSGLYAATYGECCFNNLNGPFDGEGPSHYGAMEWGPTWINPVGASQVYRNTTRGVVGFAQFDTDDGPFTFFRNVIINGDSGTSPYTHMRAVSGFSAPDWNRVTDSENLKGTAAAGYIDAAGLLTGASRTSYLHYRGHEVP